MKKLFSCAAVVMFCVSIAAAQETHFGIKAGVNIASVNVSPGGDYDGKAGLHIGGLAHIHLNKNWALQPEVVFSMQGGQNEDDAKLKLNYINIPLLVQYMTDNGFRIETGPQLGLLASAKAENGNIEVGIKDNFTSTDFSWAFGVGYLFPGGFGLDGRYNLGISDVWDANNIKMKNSVFQLGVFYQFMHQNAKGRK